MTLLKYNPVLDSEFFPAIRNMQESLSRAFNEPNSRPWTPAVDIVESEDTLELRMDVPGVEHNAIDINLENNTLTVKGERQFENQQNGRGYHRIERSYGSFARSFSLPETVDAEKVRAEFKNGVLHVALPKKELAKPRPIKIEVS